MTQLAEWRTALLADLDARLAVRGFRRRARSQSWTRDASGGRQAVHVAIIKHPPRDFDVTLDVALRVDMAEDLLEACVDEAREGARYTLGAEVGNLMDGAPRRWTVDSETALRTVAGEVDRCVEEVGEPYFQRFRNLESVLAILSSDERGAWVHAPLHAERAIRAVALSLAMKGRRQAAQMATRKLAFLKSKRDPMEQRFAALASCLLGATPGEWEVSE